jgi:hypothetical protein
MCAAVSVDVKPLNVTLTCSVWAVGSRNIVARPVPGEALEGTSFAPERLPTKVIIIAWAAGAGSISNAIRASGSERDLIATTGRDVCIFTSLHTFTIMGIVLSAQLLVKTRRLT